MNTYQNINRDKNLKEDPIINILYKIKLLPRIYL